MCWLARNDFFCAPAQRLLFAPEFPSSHLPLAYGMACQGVCSVAHAYEGRRSSVRLYVVVQARQSSDPWAELVHLQRGEGNSPGATVEDSRWQVLSYRGHPQAVL